VIVYDLIVKATRQQFFLIEIRGMAKSLTLISSIDLHVHFIAWTLHTFIKTTKPRVRFSPSNEKSHHGST